MSLARVTLFPEHVETPRLRLRRPTRTDAEAMFDRYASVPEVTRYLSWRTHVSVADTQAFIEASDRAWSEDGAGPYLVLTRGDVLVGGTGLSLEAAGSAETGYVLARDAWGRGYATEVLVAIVSLAFQVPSLTRIHAFCHPENAASRRVLEKARFLLEGLVPNHAVFPNAEPQPRDVCNYARPRARGGERS